MPRIIRHHSIYRNPDTYSTFPWIARLDEQRLGVVFRQADGFSKRAAESGAVSHHDTASWIAGLLSNDNGETWAPESYRVLYRSHYGVNDPGLTRLADGRLILRVSELDVRPSSDRARLGGRMVSHRPEFGRVSALRGNVWLAVDWSGPAPATEGQPIDCGSYTASCSREAITELADGTWVLPVYYGAPFSTDAAYLLRSYDSGVTWHDASTICRDRTAGESDCQGINFNETSILSFGDGEMLAMARADETFHTDGIYMSAGGVGWLYGARSYNWGLSWTKPERTEIFGQPAHLLKLDDQRVVCTYGYRRKPYGVRAVLSRDRGRTWDVAGEIVLREDGGMWDLGYPCTLALGNGRLLTVYYFNDDGGLRYIAGTTWTLEGAA